MEIIVLGASSCEKCDRLKKLCQEAVEGLGAEVEVKKVEDIAEVMKYGIMQTPGLVINGELVSYGRIPEKEEIERWLEKFL